MNDRNAIKSIATIFLLILLNTSCSGEPQKIADISTPTVTSTFTNTPTPDVTATPSNTPLPTATFTPAVTATIIPDIPAPAEDRGNVVGLVLWNDKPVAKAAVWLCADWSYGVCEGRISTNTDENGYYVFKNVPPRKYLAAMNSFSSSWFIFYFDENDSKEIDVPANETLTLRSWSIYKLDLRLLSPNGAISNENPVFTWEPYPDAEYYKIYIDYDANPVLFEYDIQILVDDQRVDENQFTAPEQLKACEYSWAVSAYSSKDILIAKSDYMEFINIDLPESCSK